MNMTSPSDEPFLDRLIKMMGMTGRDNDHEVLLAIRGANALLRKHGTDWESVLRSKVRIIADPFASINIPASAMNPNRNQDFRPPPPQAPSRPQPVRAQPTPPPRQRPPSPVRPKPGAPAFASDTKEKTIVNKFEGTCTKCKNKVATGDGVAHLWKRPNGTTYWTSEHTGTCGPVRKHKPATTADDFQV